MAPSAGALYGGNLVLIRVTDFVGPQSRDAIGLPTLEWARSGRQSASVIFIFEKETKNVSDVAVTLSATSTSSSSTSSPSSLPEGRSYDITFR